MADKVFDGGLRLFSYCLGALAVLLVLHAIFTAL